MPVIIKVTLGTNEKLICDECKQEITENETAYLDLDWYREVPETIYCLTCKEQAYPWL